MSCDKCKYHRPGSVPLCAHPRAQIKRGPCGMPACVVVFERTGGRCFEGKA